MRRQPSAPHKLLREAEVCHLDGSVVILAHQQQVLRLDHPTRDGPRAAASPQCRAALADTTKPLGRAERVPVIFERPASFSYSLPTRIRNPESNMLQASAQLLGPIPPEPNSLGNARSTSMKRVGGIGTGGITVSAAISRGLSHQPPIRQI